MDAKVFAAATLLAFVVIACKNFTPEILVPFRCLNCMAFICDAAFPVRMLGPRRVRKFTDCDGTGNFPPVAPAGLRCSAHHIRVVNLDDGSTLAPANGVSGTACWSKHRESSPNGTDRKVFAKLNSKCALLAELMAVTCDAMFRRGKELPALIAFAFKRNRRVCFQLLERDPPVSIDDGFSNNHLLAFHEVNNKLHGVVSIPQNEKARYRYVGAC